MPSVTAAEEVSAAPRSYNSLLRDIMLGAFRVVVVTMHVNILKLPNLHGCDICSIHLHCICRITEVIPLDILSFIAFL